MAMMAQAAASAVNRFGLGARGDEIAVVGGDPRGWLLAHGHAIIAPITQTELQQAEAVFLSNAVRGILPVRRLGDTYWPSVHPAIRGLQAQLATAHPGFTPYSEAQVK